MGACSGKKVVQLGTVQPVVSVADPPRHKSIGRTPMQDLADLKKMYEDEGQYMNRKVKACFELVFAGDASTTTEINMKFINLGEVGTMHLSKVIPYFPSLKSLRLWKTKLGVEGAKILASVLPRCPQLEILSLEDNEIRAEGVSYIAKSLPSLTLLKELYLHVNKMGQEGVTSLSTALSVKTNLRILTMDENQFGRAGLLVLLASLNNTLRTLSLLGLAFNNLGDEGARELLDVLKKMPELKKLTLSGNNITPPMERMLMSAAAGVDFLF